MNFVDPSERPNANWKNVLMLMLLGILGDLRVRFSVDLDFSSALLRIRGAMVEAALNSNKRRLSVLQDATCKKGCSGCCRRMIQVTVAEAIIIQEHLEVNGRWTEVAKKCHVDLKVVRESNPVSWFRMNIPCPVLTDKDECGAYAVRPAVCSVHFARSNPDLCHPWATEVGDMLPVELTDVYLDFEKALHSSVDGHGVLALKMPLPASLLMAERIRKQPNLTVQSLIRLIYNELR